MTVIESTKVEVISLTPAAADAVRDLFAKRELEGYALRVFVQGGGCSGFQYGMALENNIREQDTVFESHGVDVVVDEVSIQHISGSTVDFVEDVMGSGFKVENPNAMSSCGCGSSFQSKDGGGSSAGGCSC
jgi:iron-sulfur cluster assembly accessory protein